MEKINVDQTLSMKLAELRNQAVLHDEQGRVLGYFSPIREPTRLDELQLESPRTAEETEAMRRRARANPGRPLQEILRELGK